MGEKIDEEAERGKVKIFDIWSAVQLRVTLSVFATRRPRSSSRNALCGMRSERRRVSEVADVRIIWPVLDLLARHFCDRRRYRCLSRRRVSRADFAFAENSLPFVLLLVLCFLHTPLLIADWIPGRTFGAANLCLSTSHL